MTDRWVPTIRARLTAWYALALAAMMIVYASATFIAVRHEFREQLDERLHGDFEAAERGLTRTAGDRVTWASTHEDADQETRVYEVWSATGEQIHRSGASVTLPPPPPTSAAYAYRYETIEANGGYWRTVAAPVTISGLDVVLRVSQSEERVREELREVLVVLVLGLPLVVLLAGAGGYLLARRALSPIDHLASEAQRITADRLHERLKVPNESDEIGRLTAVINQTIGRLESSFDQLRRFTADSSHELRTPLAVVRGLGEAAVAERRSPAEYEEAIGSMLEEVDRMSGLVDTLLRLARGDAGTIRLSREDLDLGQLVREVALALGILAEERNQAIAFDIAEGIKVSVDRLVLREALSNVIDNAIKYGPRGSSITVRVQREGPGALIAVSDNGPGVPVELRERVFDRFFRVDASRTRHAGGAGLGLAIAKWAVEVHDGRISVHEPLTGGAEFRIVLSTVEDGSPASNRPEGKTCGLDGKSMSC